MNFLFVTVLLETLVRDQSWNPQIGDVYFLFAAQNA